MMNLRSIARRIHRDEDGTSITEFVITLPVFVFSFIAILHLYGLGDHGLRATGTAYARALDDFKEVQTDWVPVDWAVNPVAAGTEAGIWHWKVSESRTRDKIADEVFDTVPIGAGHIFESYSRIAISGPPSWAAETVELDPPNAHRTVNSLVTMPDSISPTTGEIRYGHHEGGTGSVFAAELMSDTVNISGLSGKKGWMGYMNGLIDTAGARPAFAAGMRYGVTTEGEYDETVNFMNTDYPIQTSTHIAVGPRPTSKWITVAVIRAYLAQDEAYDDSMLAFEMDVNTSDPAAEKAQECQENLEGISVTDWGAVSDLMDNIESGDPCGNGASAGSGNPLSFITGPLSNAAEFFGGPVPTDTKTGDVPSDSVF